MTDCDGEVRLGKNYGVEQPGPLLCEWARGGHKSMWGDFWGSGQFDEFSRITFCWKIRINRVECEELFCKTNINSIKLIIN